jgi:hypothetical protein
VLRTIGEPRVERVGIHAEGASRGERHATGFAHQTWVRVHRRRLLPDRKRLARAVEDRAPAGRDRHRLEVLARGHLRERPGLDALQPDGAAERRREDENEESE